MNKNLTFKINSIYVLEVFCQTQSNETSFKKQDTEKEVKIFNFMMRNLKITDAFRAHKINIEKLQNRLARSLKSLVHL